MKRKVVVISLVCLLAIAAIGYFGYRSLVSSVMLEDFITASFAKVGITEVTKVEGVLEDIVSVEYDDDIDPRVVAGRLFELPEVTHAQTNNLYHVALGTPPEGPNYELGVVLIQIDRDAIRAARFRHVVNKYFKKTSP